MVDYDMLSNAEIRIKLIELENKYEAVKVLVNENINKMEQLDSEYLKAKKVLQKRTKGVL